MNLTFPRTRHPRPWFGNGLGRLLGSDPFMQPWSGTWLDQGPTVFPALTAWSDEEALYLEAELPGLPLDALDLTVKGDELTIAGERPEMIEEGVTYHRRERDVGKFSRILRLPFEVDAEKIEARLEHGVLLITLPKAEAVRPHKIEVKAVR